jgi:CubicO group peptidase (beta-lactamase class C family)
VSSESDPELLARLNDCTSGATRRFAASVIDLDAEPRSRFAFLASSPSRRFEIGSLTKALTGMLLADTVERGLVSLDTTVGHIVPVHGRNELQSITLKELATHSSGLPRMPRGEVRLRALPFVLAGLNPYRGISPRTVMRSAARQRLGERGVSLYSNLGGALVGQLLAVAAGTDFPSLLTERILEPLGMDSSGVSTRGDRAAWGRSPRGLPREPWIMGGYAPAGGVYSTIEDLSRLAIALLEGNAPGMRSVMPVDGVRTHGPTRRSGLFWIIDDDGGNSVIWHNGGTGGYSTLFVMVPRVRRAVVVLENAARDHARLGRIAAALLT